MRTSQQIAQSDDDILRGLSASQLEWIKIIIQQFQLPCEFIRNPNSDLITPSVLEGLGDALRIHHAYSKQALSKDRFEFVLEMVLNGAGIPAK